MGPAVEAQLRLVGLGPLDLDHERGALVLDGGVGEDGVGDRQTRKYLDLDPRVDGGLLVACGNHFRRHFVEKELKGRTWYAPEEV